MVIMQIFLHDTWQNSEQLHYSNSNLFYRIFFIRNNKTLHPKVKHKHWFYLETQTG